MTGPRVRFCCSMQTAFDNLDYLRAALARKPGIRDAAAIPRLVRVFDATADAARLLRFKRATGYRDDGWLPLTYPQVLAFRAHLANMVDRRFPLPLMGTVHMANTIRCFRPLREHEGLRLECALEGRRTDERGTWFDLVTKANALPANEPVYEAVATMLRPAPRRERHRSEPPPPVDLPPGATTIPVDAGMIRAFALASGDFNPIHLTGLTARLFGFRGQLAHGMWSLSRIAAELAALARAMGGVTLTADFRRPVYLPATLVLATAATETGRTFKLTDATGTTTHVEGTLASTPRSP